MLEYIPAALATKCRQYNKLHHENMAHRDMVLVTTESADSLPFSLLWAGFTLLRIRGEGKSILVPVCYSNTNKHLGNKPPFPDQHLFIQQRVSSGTGNAMGIHKHVFFGLHSPQ